jgi:hypothetical protein
MAIGLLLTIVGMILDPVFDVDYPHQLGKLAILLIFGPLAVLVTLGIIYTCIHYIY